MQVSLLAAKHVVHEQKKCPFNMYDPIIVVSKVSTGGLIALNHICRQTINTSTPTQAFSQRNVFWMRELFFIKTLYTSTQIPLHRHPNELSTV